VSGYRETLLTWQWTTADGGTTWTCSLLPGHAIVLGPAERRAWQPRSWTHQAPDGRGITGHGAQQLDYHLMRMAQRSA
jgi:hypothetical protein